MRFQIAHHDYRHTLLKDGSVETSLYRREVQVARVVD